MCGIVGLLVKKREHCEKLGEWMTPMGRNTYRSTTFSPKVLRLFDAHGTRSPDGAWVHELGSRLSTSGMGANSAWGSS